jgi:hypothetical protein
VGIGWIFGREIWRLGKQGLFAFYFLFAGN